VESVNIVEANDRTRLVLNLDQMANYQTVVDGNILRVTVDGDTDAQSAPESIPGYNDQLLTPNDSAFGTDVDDGGVVLELPASLPLNSGSGDAAPSAADQQIIMQEQITDTVDSSLIDVKTGAPIQELIEDTQPSPIEMAPMPKVDDVAYEPPKNSIDYSTPTPVNFSTPPAQGSTRYTGEELSLNFQDIEVRSVLQLLADFTDLNIVVSDSVSGKVTLRLKDVPWDQALDIILRTKGLDKRAAGNVIMVAPAAEIEARETAEREAAKKAIELEPLRTEFVQVNYAKAVEVAALLKSESGGVLSERGNVTIDDRTNTILVNDTAGAPG